MYSFMRKVNIFNFDTFYLTYDEPNKYERFQKVKSQIPLLINVDNIKGFDRAHKECGRLAVTDYVTIIDGDNTLIMNPGEIKVDKRLLNHKQVLSFSSLNSINNLAYGNGGVKCWPKEVLLNMKSHEEAQNKKGATDFCYILPYYQLPHVVTKTNIHLTPYQAFRAGFREGIKMCLNNGVPHNDFYEIFAKKHKQNLYRLKVWCEVGRDVINGDWSIYGARLGAVTILSNPDDYTKIQDYCFLEKLWRSKIQNLNPNTESSKLLKILNKDFFLNIGELSDSQSQAFKKIIHNPRREGLMTL